MTKAAIAGVSVWAVRDPSTRNVPIGGLLETSGNTIAPLLVSAERAAEALGMSLEAFERYVQPGLEVVGSGPDVLVPMAELRRWAAMSADEQRAA